MKKYNMTENKQEEKFQLELIQDLPEHIKLELKPNDMLLKGRSLHESFLPEPWLTELAADSRNARAIWRHKDPENPEDLGLVYGRNIHNEVKDGFIETYYRIFGDSEKEKKMQTLIKTKLELNEPIGISKGFIKQYNENGDIRRVISLEDSITYKPQCKSCVTQEVIQMEEKEMKELVEKLQKELDTTKMQLEAKDTDLAEKEANIEAEKSVLKEKLEELETKLKTKSTEKVTLEDKFVELNDAFKTYKLEQTVLRKQPVIDEILEYEDDSMREALRTVYSGWEIKKLEERLAENKGKEDAPAIMTKTFAQERKEAMEKLDIKDVGMSALYGLTGKEATLANDIEKEMRAEGVLK